MANAQPKLLFPQLQSFYTWVEPLSYVLIRVTVGLMLIPHGAKGDGACSIALFNGRWIWRAHEPGAPWKALTLGTTLTIGGLSYSARPGVYDDF